MMFGPDAHAVRSGWGARFLLIGPIFPPYAELAAFAVALVGVAAIELLLRLTRWGQTVRAVADDPEIAELVGMNAQRINIGTFALSAGLAGLAGAVLVMYYPVNPLVGAELMPIALIASVLGGLGSVGGAFLGGILCAIVVQLIPTKSIVRRRPTIAASKRALDRKREHAMPGGITGGKKVSIFSTEEAGRTTEHTEKTSFGASCGV